MGCDGGTIPKRHELVRTKKKAEEKDKQAELAWKWQYCTLSNQMLKEPIVACELGRIYNKDAVIEYLLEKRSSNKMEKMSHIKGLKDLHVLVLTKNQAWVKQAEKGDGYIDTHSAKYICPVAGIEMNGTYRFSFLRTCKCVLSERALKEVRGSVCPSCSKEFTKESDVIILNGTEEEEKVLREKMEKRKEAAKNEKRKAKKEKKINNDTNGIERKDKSAVDSAPSTSKVNGHASHVDTKSSTLSVDKGITVKNGKSEKNGKIEKNAKTPKNEKPGKNLSVCSTVEGAKHKLKDEKIFQTDTFKSLFTSHSSAKRAKDKNGHWITYNPYHYAG